MADHEEQPTAIESVLELLSEHGLGAMAEAMQTLLNEAMKLERSESRASPGERTGRARGLREWLQGQGIAQPHRRARAPGATGAAAAGRRGSGPSPKSLERGLRSERALKLAIAEMYVQGVLTRRVTEITRELCAASR